MKICLKAALLALTVGLTVTQAAEDVRSGPSDQARGPFDVKAITGEHRKGSEKEQLCYFCQYSQQKRPAVAMIFTQKADDNLAVLVKAIDEVQKNDKNLGTVVIGVGGVTDADFEKLQETHKLAAPLTIAVDKDGPPAYKLNSKAAVTVLIYKQPGHKITKNFAFADTKSAKDKAKEVGDAVREALTK
jgi:hypothetical protein